MTEIRDATIAILKSILLADNGINGGFRPIKNTTKKDCYNALGALQELYKSNSANNKDTGNKKIYKLTTDAIGYETYNSIVLVAENEEEARKKAKEFSKDFNDERIMRTRTKTLHRREFGKRESLRAQGWELKKQYRVMYAPEEIVDDAVEREVWIKKERLNVRCFEIGTAVENITSGHYYDDDYYDDEYMRNNLILCASYNGG